MEITITRDGMKEPARFTSSDVALEAVRLAGLQAGPGTRVTLTTNAYDSFDAILRAVGYFHDFESSLDLSQWAGEHKRWRRGESESIPPAEFLELLESVMAAVRRRFAGICTEDDEPTELDT